jgi:hypothetical protein
MPAASPIAYVASAEGGTTRRRRDLRIAAVLGEYGYSADVGCAETELLGLGPEMLERVSAASLVVCDLVRPDRDVPVEVAIAATRGTAVLALVPAAAVLDGCAAQLLADCGATILRYDRAEPHQVLLAHLAAREGGDPVDQRGAGSGCHASWGAK